MVRLSRRLVAAAVAVPLVVGLAACSSPAAKAPSASSSCTPSKGKVTLTYWSWLPSAKQVVAAFNQTHPNIQVKLQVLAGGATAYQSLFNALKAKNQPDLAMIEYDHIANFRAQNGLTDVSACKPVADLKNQVVPWTFNQVSLGTNAIYATPTDTGPLALYYRKDIFAKYHLPVPTTWAQYMTDAEKLKAAAPNVAMTSFTPQDAVMLQGLDWQAGAKPYSYSSNAFDIDMNSPAVNKVSDYWQSMIDKKLVNTNIQPLTPAQYTAWNNGTVATSIGAVWQYAIMESSSPKAAGKWAVAPLPSWTAGTEAGANYGGATTAIMSGTKHPYEAAVFADWVSTNPAATKIIFAGGGTAASVAYSKSSAIDNTDKYFGGEAITKVFQDMSDHTDNSFQWAPDQTNLNNYLQDALTGAFNGGSTIQKAYAATQAKVVSDLKSQSIPVTAK